MKTVLEELVKYRRFDIGDHVFINVPEGDACIVFALVIYNTHVEYYVRTKDNTVMQLDASSLTEIKQF